MEIREILSKVDHTLLGVDSTWEQIRRICDDGLKYRTASVCIPASFVARAADHIGGIIPICTVIGFPNGYSTKESKVFEAKDAIRKGALEVDMVINVGDLKDRRYAEMTDEIRSIKEAIVEESPFAILKVIIETCLLTDDEKKKMCEIVTEANADFIKTSTGFSKAGATFEDVALMKKYVGPYVRVKAAGGISSIGDAEKFIELGADRLGTSRIVKIVKEQNLI